MKRFSITSTGLAITAYTACAMSAGCTHSLRSDAVDMSLVRNVPLIEGQISGSEKGLWFLIDTGVDPSVIDLAAARFYGLPIDETEVGEASGSGDGRGLAVMRSSIEGLSIAGRTHPPIEALAADLSSFSLALETDLAGILGYSFLKSKVVRIDYGAKQIVFADTPKRLPAGRSTVTETYRTALRFNASDDPIPVFDILVSGTPVTVSLDTGKSAGVEFYGPATDRLSLNEFAADGAAKTTLGARGARTVKTGVLSSVELGPFSIEDVPVSFSDMIPDGEAREGNAGNSFLQNFVITIDYVNREIIFEK